MVTIDAGGGEVADPFEVGGVLKVVRCIVQHRIACVIGGNGGEEMGGFADWQRGAGPDYRVDPFGFQNLSLLFASCGADDAPALFKEKRGKGAGREPVADGEEGACH